MYLCGKKNNTALCLDAVKLCPCGGKINHEDTEFTKTPMV